VKERKRRSVLQSARADYQNRLTQYSRYIEPVPISNRTDDESNKNQRRRRSWALCYLLVDCCPSVSPARMSSWGRWGWKTYTGQSIEHHSKSDGSSTRGKFRRLGVSTDLLRRPADAATAGYVKKMRQIFRLKIKNK